MTEGKERKMMGNEDCAPLFETRKAKGRALYRLFAVTELLGICCIWVYRISHIPEENEAGIRWIWIGLFGAELWFGFYWIITQSLRWNLVFRQTFKDRLSRRYEKELPGVDVFVCTADSTLEPPTIVINTVLSVMAYDYPPEKLSVYLSDDGCSHLTFYALFEASSFAKHWIPYCKKFKVEPTSPAAYFASIPQIQPCGNDDKQFKHLATIKKLYEEMENRIQAAVKLDRISKETKSKHKGFSQWESSYSSRSDHDTILQILIDGKDPNAVDIEGCSLPTLVYLAREKRPQHFHNYKAGALNALIRVSSKISNGSIILNVDCDMYSNSSQSLRDALCFFLDEKEGHEYAYVQFSQHFDNVTKNDLYGTLLRVAGEVEFYGMDGFGGPLYGGTGCYHRRETLCGREFSKKTKIEWRRKEDDRKRMGSLSKLEDEAKALASCTFEENTLWGIEMGVKYGCPVEDVITGISIQSKGWKSVYFNPKRKAFVGIAPNTLSQTLVQQKRWSEGDLEILLSKYSPAWYAYGKISLGLQMGYCAYCLWAPNALPTLYYSVIPSLYLLKGIPLFPQLSSPWFIPFAYVILAKYTYSLAEFLWSGGTILGWWNDQRMWLYNRTSSYFFAFIDAILKTLGFSESGFIVTAKVADKDVLKRHGEEVMEFGVSSSMFIILATLALLNLFCFLVTIVKSLAFDGAGVLGKSGMFLQVLLCGILVLINWPLYQGLFLRKDRGKMPTSVTIKALVFAVSICICFSYWH